MIGSCLRNNAVKWMRWAAVNPQFRAKHTKYVQKSVTDEYSRSPQPGEVRESLESSLQRPHLDRKRLKEMLLLVEQHTGIWKRKVDHSELPPDQKLASNILRHLMSCAEECPPSVVATVCNLARQRYRRKRLPTLYEAFCRATSRRAVVEQWPMKLCWPVSLWFARCGFSDTVFLRYLADRMLVEHFILNNVVQNLRPFALLNFRPPTKLIDNVLEATPYNKWRGTLESLAFDCAVLGVYPQWLLRRVFQDHERTALLEKAPELVWTKLYLLQRAVAAECGDYDGPWMSPAEVERARHLLRRTAAAEEPLGPGLAAALPATVHLLDGCWTRTGHWIEHVLVPAVRPTETPETPPEATAEDAFLEDVVPAYPENSIVLMKVFHAEHYLMNCDQLRGPYHLEVRTLERATGLPVVALSRQRWLELGRDLRPVYLSEMLAETRDPSRNGNANHWRCARATGPSCRPTVSLLDELRLTQACRAVQNHVRDHVTRHGAGDGRDLGADYADLWLSLRVKAEDFTEVDNVAVCLKAAVDCGLAVDDATVAALLEAVAGRCHQLATKKIRFLLLLLGRAYGADQPLRRPLQAALQRRLVRMLTQWRPEATVDLVADRLLEQRDQWNSSMAVDILNALARTCPSSPPQALLEETLHRLEKSLAAGEVDLPDARTLNATCVYLNKYDWGSEPLVRQLADRATAQRWPLNLCRQAVDLVSKRGLVHAALLEHFAGLVLQTEARRCRPLLDLRPLAELDYRPAVLERLIDWLLRSPHLQPDAVDHKRLATFLLDLAVFGVYPQPILRYVLQADYVQKHVPVAWQPMVHKTLQQLEPCVRVECADYDGPWPEAGRPAEAAEAAEAADTQRRPSPVERPLQTALGGSFYLLSGVRTRFGHHIDHLVVLRTGGYPVAINVESSNDKPLAFVEDLVLPANHKKIAVKLFRGTDYLAAGGRRLRGPAGLTLRTLRAAGYGVVDVDVDAFASLADKERIPFLMKQIRLQE